MITTNNQIKKIELPKKLIALPCCKITGFKLRVSPTGTKIFYITYTFDKKTINLRIGNANDINIKDAANIAKKYRSLIDAGINPKKENIKSITLTDFLFNHYFKYINIHQKRPDNTKQILTSSFSHLLNKSLKDISTNDLNDYVIKSKNKLVNASINKNLGMLKTALNYAVNNNFIDTSPFTNIKKLKVDKQTNRKFFTENEQNKLLISAINIGEKEYFFILFLLKTGLRISETLDIKWEYFDLKKEQLKLPGQITKNQRSRIVYLSKSMMSELEKYKPKKLIGNVFDINPTKLWKELRVNAQVEKHRLYDLRHTFASNLIQKGVSIEIISKLMGHSDIKTTMIYSKFKPQNLIEAINQ